MGRGEAGCGVVGGMGMGWGRVFFGRKDGGELFGEGGMEVGIFDVVGWFLS